MTALPRARPGNAMELKKKKIPWDYKKLLNIVW